MCRGDAACQNPVCLFHGGRMIPPCLFRDCSNAIRVSFLRRRGGCFHILTSKIFIARPSRSLTWSSFSSKYGQPLSITSDFESECNSANPILHSFFLDTIAPSTTGEVRLNLGVGGDGVVGRTVSILDGRSRRILGEGVIGWS